MSKIYKIFEPDDWAAFQMQGRTDGSALDKRDGFLHASSADQLAGTLNAHFPSTDRLFLAEILIKQVQADLTWEPARGMLFPHIYRTLALSDIAQHWILERGENGDYILPILNGDA